MVVTWQFAGALSDLSVTTLYEIMQLRAKVFIVEQACVYLDLDGYDKACVHVIGTSATGGDAKIVAYARVLPPHTKGNSQQVPMIGRVVVAPEARGQGLASELMVKAMDVCTERWPQGGIAISAQVHLESFYSRLGFHTTSAEPYDDDGIMHIDMHRP
ncbi:hypothetical protein H257_09567 [Aphanomyces astaci]|uniref:Glucosamine 6-phosphate N-acetyltransferase n=2 Tax=Aphanomyces astaci TaxID=112090 RepID=W4GCB6_APHAT|nr:hypothetical protein H257_09567 [Aphanomyces astaci]ETV76568.1 hypothetical protein H257_09567 [Aphanomyces astaci]RHY58360.1 hypothetical protein DYB34_012011 [Aphanomyces astaci]RHY88016.1 hypothetical protein DYB31_015325 [Aphanomyces astaci]|eukprot:XP_009834113.1 hypothetical protein H257_09567 [Aphanomyces astaci]